MKECAPHATTWEETTFRARLLAADGELGFLGLSMPEAYGGQGGDYYTNIVLARSSPSPARAACRWASRLHTDMATPPILQFGTEEQKQRYLVPAIKGEKISCLGITEPDAGSDVSGIRPAPCATATSGSSTARRPTSPTATGPTSSCW
jgi:alkylation response protein AidB-like acyl-CoA dehydrogenase